MPTNVDIKDSKFVGLIDVPEVEDIVGRFQYNFFVPDEKINDDGIPRFQGALKKMTLDGAQNSFVDNTQKEIDVGVLSAEVPRYVHLHWTPRKLANQYQGFGSYINSGLSGLMRDGIGGGFIQGVSQIDNINLEEDVTALTDASIRTRDVHIRERLRKKILHYAKLKGADTSSAQETLKVFKDLEDLDSTIVEDMLDKFNDDALGFVNVINEIIRTRRFEKASNLKVTSLVDRRIGRLIFNGLFRKRTENITLEETFKKDYEENAWAIQESNTAESFEPNIKIFEITKSEKDSFEYGAAMIGYIVERRRVGEHGTFDESTAEFSYIDGTDNSTFFDTRVKYGLEYSYTVRSVAMIEFVASLADNPKTKSLDAGFYKIKAIIASKPSKSVPITCVERRPPVEPDGVLYRYNYDHGTGLLINWQQPAGSQRDIKYFQVFRRRSIKDPFTCIAELDFDDTIYEGAEMNIFQVKPEVVREDRVFKFNFTRTFFNDSRFDRDSKYIYALAAVDAHGLTSPYSAQTEVGFNKIKNELTLKTISRGGAPKQYPNFFIDPSLDDNFAVDSLRSDAMLSSRKQTITVYFDPDAETVKPGGNESFVQDRDRIIKGGGYDSSARYYLNLLNVDRQKATNVEINVKTARWVKTAFGNFI